MAPKIKISKEDIVNASVELVRTGGDDALNTRAIASYLGCSTQPIFSNFSSMEELKLEVVKKADELCAAYTQREIESGEFPIYKARGMAYIRFAKEEKELFKLLYMRDRALEDTAEQDEVSSKEAIKNVTENTGLTADDAKLFHLEIWSFVHGIATMLATGFLDLDRELISKMITDAYQGLKHRFGKE